MSKAVRPRPRPSNLMSAHKTSTPATAPGVQSGSAQAPMTSIRPQPRPDDLMEGRPTAPGHYPNIGMQDETDRFGDLGARKRRGDPSGVVLHQTDSYTGDQVRTAYDNRIRKGSSIGAHYLIDEEGESSLTVPTDEVVYHAKGHNSSDIGIEVVGKAQQVNPRGDLHAQIAEIGLTPQLEERLMAMSPAELKRTMRDNGNWIYGDITGPQKRATWNLLREIGKEHGIDMSDDVHAHEHVQAKTIGEGENIEEMVETMQAWPDKVAALEQLIEEKKASGADAAELAELEERLAMERALQEAVSLDGTVAENNALEGERLLGEPGAATEREGMREQFWDGFYPHMQGLDGLVS